MTGMMNTCSIIATNIQLLPRGRICNFQTKRVLKVGAGARKMRFVICVILDSSYSNNVWANPPKCRFMLQARDGVGHTPLFWAAKGGHTEMVTLLLSKGAHINAQDEKEVRSGNAGLPNARRMTALRRLQ